MHTPPHRKEKGNANSPRVAPGADLRLKISYELPSLVLLLGGSASLHSPGTAAACVPAACMWKAGDVPVRMIEVISPAGFENFFRELSELLLSVSQPDVAQIAEIAGRYGLQFGQPDWLPDVISRYNLTPLPE
jgi:hypothetical protein